MSWKTISFPVGFGSRVVLSIGYLPTNRHKRWKRIFGDRYDYDSAPLRSTWKVVRLNGDTRYREGHHMIGYRLWLYWWSGQCVNLDAQLSFKRCPWPKGHKYGPHDRPSEPASAS